MSGLTIPMLSSSSLTSPPANQATGGRKDDPARARDAAQQFEALLVAQLLRSARASSGWGESDTSGECATDFAEQQFALVLARQGGLGLAPVIAAGLERKPADPVPGSNPQR